MNTPEDDERELIYRAQAGEAIAFERLAEPHACGAARWPLARIATGPRILRKRLVPVRSSKAAVQAPARAGQFAQTERR